MPSRPSKGQKSKKRMPSETNNQNQLAGGNEAGAIGTQHDQMSQQHASQATPASTGNKKTNRRSRGTTNKLKSQHRSAGTPNAGGELLMSPSEGFELYQVLGKIAARNKHLGTKAVRAGFQSIAQTGSFI